MSMFWLHQISIKKKNFAVPQELITSEWAAVETILSTLDLLKRGRP